MRHRALAAIFLLALVLRLAVVLALPRLPIGLDDMFQYDMLARSIVAGNGYRWYAQQDLRLVQRYVDMEPPPEYDPRGILTSFRAPLYPAFLALVYAVVGIGWQRLFAARLVQAWIGASLAPLAALLARQLGFSERAARWAAVAIAVFPLLIVYPMALVTENLFIPLLALSLWAVLRAGKEQRWRDYALAGLFLGLTTLTRSIVALFVPIAALWAWAIARPRWTGLLHGALLFACFLLVTVPWSIRNTVLHGEFFFVESTLGYNLYMGYHPQSSGTFSADFSLDLVPILDDAERNRIGTEAAWYFIASDPGRVPYLMLRKLGYFWELDRRAFQYFYSNGFFGHWPSGVVVGVFVLLCLPLMVIAPAGLAGLAMTRPRRETVLVALLVLYYVGIHMLIMAESRFHLPLLPILAALAAHAFVDRPDRCAARWQKALALVLVLLLFANWSAELVRDWGLLGELVGPQGHRLRLSY
ncbi:MAG: glycosyltransferase family 39 protein [Anaerolineae bacterium]|nr:glycosyltransferase family 39 protein [Anaerolineae bacterium]